MTLLEYVAEKLLGPSDRYGYWDCPRCGKHKFHCKPHKPPHPDKFKCFACDFWGDEFDLLRHFFPGEKYRQLETRLHGFQLEYDRDVQEGRVSQPTIFSPGIATDDEHDKVADFDWVIEAEQRHLAECTDPQCDDFVCRQARGLPPLTLAEHRAQAAREKQQRRERITKLAETIKRRNRQCQK
jgi:hypothetical protein